jgi:hypothetical protein
MLLTVILASCLTSGYAARHEHHQSESIYDGIITNIALKTFNCSNYNDTCYHPSFTISIPKLGNKKINFEINCRNKVECVTSFFSINNLVKIKYFQSTNTYVLLRPEPKKSTENMVYIILGVIMVVGIFICVSYVKINGMTNSSSSSSSSEQEIPPMYVETENEPPQYISIETTINDPERENDNTQISDIASTNNDDTTRITSTSLLIC